MQQILPGYLAGGEAIDGFLRREEEIWLVFLPVPLETMAAQDIMGHAQKVFPALRQFLEDRDLASSVIYRRDVYPDPRHPCCWNTHTLKADPLSLSYHVAVTIRNESWYDPDVGRGLMVVDITVREHCSLTGAVRAVHALPEALRYNLLSCDTVCH